MTASKSFSNDLIDGLLANYKKPEDLLGENASGNTRNGKSRKTLKGDFGELPIKIPRDHP